MPLRALLTRRIVQRFKLGSYPTRLRLDAVDRPWYGHCVYHSAALARALGIERISVIEFGVAGGSGLLCLEEHARETEKALGVRIDVVGFDSGSGLPAAADYRDLPYAWPAGSFPMKQEELRARLSRASLVIGDVRETVAAFSANKDVAPLGAVMFDLDLYTSTAAAMTLLDTMPPNTLPRVRCYFDDIVGYEDTLYSDFTGVRLAIREFNRRHAEDTQQLSESHSFLGRIPQYWHRQIYVCHYFKHPIYNQPLSSGPHQLPLD